jgi:hypothetical protein
VERMTVEFFLEYKKQRQRKTQKSGTTACGQTVTIWTNANNVYFEWY